MAKKQAARTTATKKKAAKRRGRIQSYAFIDTNIFLDFYRGTNDASLSLLEKLKPVRDRVICTYQVEMEFLKNRQAVLLGAANAISAQVSTTIPAVLSDDRIQKSMKSIKDDSKKRKAQIEKRIAALLKNPKANDRVYNVLEEIFTSKAGHVLTRDMKERQQIKRRAWKRFMLGYPPRKSNDTSIGDGLNWEWIIHCSNQLKGRLYIVSRDGDYGCEMNGNYYLNDQLKSEFRARVGNKSIVFTKKLSDALKGLEVKVSREEEEAEDKSITASSLSSSTTSSLRGLNNIVLPNYAAQIQKAMEGVKLPDYSNILKAIEGITIPDYSAMIRESLRGLEGLNIPGDIEIEDED